MFRFLFLLLVSLDAFGVASNEPSEVNDVVVGYYIDLPSASSACSSSKGSACDNVPVPSYGYYWTLADWNNGAQVSHISGCPNPTTGYSCTSYYYYFDPQGCPAGTLPNPQTGLCEESCSFGSLDPDCSVDCPAQDYTYFLNGIEFRGTMVAGTVGHGQSCPSPPYPSGTGDGCVGSVGMCGENWSEANNGDSSVTTTETESTTTTDGSGNTSTTTTSTTSTTSGSGGSGGSGGDTFADPNNGSGDGTLYDDAGNPLPDDDNPLNDWEPDTGINIGDQTFGICNHGGLYNSDVGCDYQTNNCASGDVDSAFGCIPLVDNGNLPEQDPTSTTTTETSADGNTTTTTTTESSGSSGNINGSGSGSGSGDGDGDGQEPQDNSSGSASSDCETPPSSSGDAQLAAIHQQLWNNRCMSETSGSTSCDAAFSCDGDFFECEILRRNHEFDCIETEEEDIKELVEGLASDEGFTSVDDLDAAATASEINFDEEIDLAEHVTALESVSTTSGTCMADISLALGPLGTISVPLSELCTLLMWIGYLVRLTAALVAFRMLFTTIQGV